MPITPTTLRAHTATLCKWRAAKAPTDARVGEAERWWRLRNTGELARRHPLAADGGHHSASAWLHNVIVNKHADATDAYPEPHILPREADDVAEAATLSAILPVILEQNRFEQTWSDLAWQKLKTGTAVCKVIWDAAAHGGVGEIAIRRVDLRDIVYEPGLPDIQDSRALYHIDWVARDELLAAYPRLSPHDLRSTLTPADAGDDRVAVVEVYYKVPAGGRKILHYCRYVGEIPLYATENDPELSTRGLYDHGLYPYVLDPLFPLDDAPCGYGYVDLCRGAQTEIDLLKTAYIRNAMVGATPRYFARGEGVNEQEFLDLSRPLVHVGSADPDTLRRIEHDTLSPTYLELYDRTVKELRETSGNTETGTGNVSAGVTAAAAIEALQQASGKGIRDANAASYRAFSRVVELCIELLRQFHTLPRRFRVTAADGSQAFLPYTADGLREQGEAHRLPLFDVKVEARRRSAFSSAAQNELTLNLFERGFFDPARRAEALAALDLLSFEGKETLKRGWEVSP